MSKHDPNRQPRYLLADLEQQAEAIAKGTGDWPYFRARETAEDWLRQEVETTGSVFTTELLWQRPYLRNLFGDVILGYSVVSPMESEDPNELGRQIRVDVPDFLHGVKVRVESIDRPSVDEDPGGKLPIAWKEGSRLKTPIELAQDHRNPSAKRQPQLTDNVIDTGKTEAELTVKQAWLCLKSRGKGHRKRMSPGELYHLEYYQELPPPLPSTEEDDGEPQRKRRWFGKDKTHATA